MPNKEFMIPWINKAGDKERVPSAPNTSDETPIELDEEVMAEIAKGREWKPAPTVEDKFGEMQDAVLRGEVSSTDAANELLSSLAKSVAGKDTDPKVVEDIIIGSRALAKTYLEEVLSGRGAYHSPQEAIDDLRALLNKNLDRVSGGRKTEPSEETNQPEILAPAFTEAKSQDELREMLSYLAQDILGDTDPSKVRSMVDQTVVLTQTLMKSPGATDSVVADGVTKAMRRIADNLRNQKRRAA